MKIAFSGTHGTGKSTSVFKKCEECKLQYKDKTVINFVENAKHSPYRINKETSERSQLWIFTNQLQQELYLAANYDILVTDRTIVDSIAYTKVAGFDSLAEAMLILAMHHMHTYDTIYMKLIQYNDYLVEDGVRIADREFRLKVENALLKLYDELKAPLTLI